jgi:hypothetical protein
MQNDRRDAILLWAVLSVVVQFAAPCFGAPLGVALGLRALFMARRDLRAMDAGVMSSARRAWIVGSHRVALVGIVLGSVLKFPRCRGRVDYAASAAVAARNSYSTGLR